ncbi:MAG: exodeoxyribonuclease VII large subunit [Deltaproteobacteria bacterium]|nr:exodeoxyribonuclease VII large subunit [Deltaproteobacteria bacterium]
MTIEKHHNIYTVSQLNSEIKFLLEDSFPFIWISGEISNCKMPGSGHLYFTLKDENSQISCVMFRGQNQKLKFELEDGLSITGLGRISLYEPRGTYQLIFEFLEPKGIGALQIAFEQLKDRLTSEGLFDDKYKRPLPFLPQKISLITSPTGAVVHDILKIIDRRFPNLFIEIVPVKVQGENSEKEIVQALELLSTLNDTDIIIMARGGGSLEDLSAFNSENVARAVFSTKIPVVSAIGHETDFTISDFVADLRAPTPSAAAELVVPSKDELKRRQEDIFSKLKSNIWQYIEKHRYILAQVSKSLVDPKRKVQDLRLKIDDLTNRLTRIFLNSINQKHEQFKLWNDLLFINKPLSYIANLNEKLANNTDKLTTLNTIYLNNKRSLIRENKGRLYALNPTAILKRGYSITRTIPGADIVKTAHSVSIGQNLEVMLAKGLLAVNVQKITDSS